MKKMLSSLVAMLLSVSLLTACGAAGSNAPGGGEADSVKVGVLAPLTGANAEFGKGFEVAMTMAMEEVNAAGGINGKTLELVSRIPRATPRKAPTSAASMWTMRTLWRCWATLPRRPAWRMPPS